MVMKDGDAFTKWILAVAASLAVAALSASLTFGFFVRSSLTRVEVTGDFIAKKVESLERQVTALTADRYTGEQASRDRDGMLKIVGSNTEAIAKLVDKVAMLSERINALEIESRRN